jgi:DNA-binding response OmpR family regulator
MDKLKPIILLVDDDKDLADLIRSGLEDLSFEVLVAFSGIEATKILETNKVDCLVTDIIMPGMNGVELANHFRKSYKTQPIFFITGYLDFPNDQLNILQPQAIIFKPFDIEEAALLVKSYFLKNPKN